MKHATASALDQLEPLLQRLRAIPILTERKRGVFYRKSAAFLHFHEDPTVLYADMRGEGGDFVRFKVDGLDAQTALAAKAAEIAPGVR